MWGEKWPLKAAKATTLMRKISKKSKKKKVGDFTIMSLASPFDITYL